MELWVVCLVTLAATVFVVDCDRIGFPFLDQEREDESSGSGHVESTPLPSPLLPIPLKVSLPWVRYTRGEGQIPNGEDRFELAAMLWNVALKIDFHEHHRVCSGNTTLPRERNTHTNCFRGEVGENCTAFMVGPHHALTAASCVYDSEAGGWKSSLNLTCMRDCGNDGRQRVLQWESVRIPQRYYQSGDARYNWAFITFSRDTPSPAWLSFGHDPFVTRGRRYRVQAYGRCQQGCACSAECKSRLTPGASAGRVTSLHCNESEDLNYHGGPVIAANPRVVCAISQRESLPRCATWISADMFWQVCQWLADSGHTPQCGPAACKQSEG